MVTLKDGTVFQTPDDKDRIPFKTRYKPSAPRQYATTGFDDGMTQQQFKEEVDVNRILEKYKKTGMLDHVNKFQGNFGDFSGVQDYQENMDRLLKAEEAFFSLPAHVRKKFANDPKNLIGFLSDPKNKKEGQELGLILPDHVKEPSFKEQMEQVLENHDAKRQKKSQQNDKKD